ncbi:hypothetical protein CDD83_2 [Cordyceps sp. RAO-2017]|nr:hypothetical protein CDD83_2 [Cordyceps sp. RAO-2017]
MRKPGEKSHMKAAAFTTPICGLTNGGPRDGTRICLKASPCSVSLPPLSLSEPAASPRIEGMSISRADQHVRIHTRCGACGFRFELGEAFYAPDPERIGHSLFPVIRRHTGNGKTPPLVVQGQFYFGKLGKFDRIRSFMEQNHALRRRYHLCDTAECSLCHVCPESGTVHADCLRLFIRLGGSDAKSIRNRLRCLWVIATWRSPWYGALPPALETYVAYRNNRDLNRLFKCLPLLSSLPPELLSMVWDLGARTELRRYCAVTDVSNNIKAFEEPQGYFMVLHDIKSWTRGYYPEQGNSGEHPIVRITIDSWGLQRIERLRDWPPSKSGGKTSTREAFIVEKLESLFGVVVHFNLSLARLQLPRGGEDSLSIWDTPCPPRLELRVTGVPHLRLPPRQLGTLRLDNCTGLTWFDIDGYIQAVHAHTHDQPSALATFETLSMQQQKKVYWDYVPLRVMKLSRFDFCPLGQTHAYYRRSSKPYQPQALTYGPDWSGLWTIEEPLWLVYIKRYDHEIMFTSAASDREECQLQWIIHHPSNGP